MESQDLWDVFQELRCSLDCVSRQEVNWMSEEPAMKHFASWFQEYVSGDNVLHCAELKEFERLHSAGEELYDEALDEALIKAGGPIDQMPILAFEINEEKDEISALREQIDILSKVEERLMTSLKQREEAEVSLRKDLLEEHKVSFKDGQDLMKMSVRIKSSLSNFHQGLQQLSSVCLSYKVADNRHFLAQAPLDDLLAQCEIFKQKMKLFIKRQFDQKEQHLINDYFAEKEHSLRMFNIHGEFKVHPQRLWEADVSRVCSLAKLKGTAAALETMQFSGKALVDPTTVGNIRLYSARLQDECSVLASEIEILRQYELSTAAQNYVVFKIGAVAEDVARHRCIRRRYRLEKLQRLQDKITRHVLLTDLLWMLLRRENKLVKLSGQYIDQAVTLLKQEHTKHVAVMELHKDIEQRHAAFSQSVARGEIPHIANMCRLMNLKQTDDIAVLADAIQDLRRCLEEVNQKNFSAGGLDLAMEKNVKVLRDALVAGPTKQITIIPSDILKKIRVANNTHRQLGRKIHELERNFVAKQMYFSKHPIQRDSRLLWAWFLSDPSKLHTAMKYAERTSQNVGKQLY